MKPDKDKDAPKTPAKKTNGNKVFDVSRPGKTPASPTSKPVISGHKPEAAAAQAAVSGVGESRPLLTRRKIEITPLGEVKAEPVKTSPEDQPSGSPTQEETEGLGTAALDAATAGPPELHQEKAPARMHTQPKLTIQPLSQDKPAEEGEQPPAEPEAEKPAEAVAEEKPAEEQAKPEEPEAKPEAEKPEPTDTESQAETEPAAKPEPELSEEELPAESSSMPEVEAVENTEEGKEEPAPEPVIEPLFDESGAVVVSNHEHHHKGHGLKVFLLLLLILVLAVAAIDILLDMGILTIEGIPHTDWL